MAVGGTYRIAVDAFSGNGLASSAFYDLINGEDQRRAVFAESLDKQVEQNAESLQGTPSGTGQKAVAFAKNFLLA